MANRSEQLCDQYRLEAEALWKQLLSAGSEGRKAELRGRYREALENYRRQKALLEEAPGASGDPLEGEARSRSRPVLPGKYPDPFDFLDYREFLLAWMKEAERSPKSFKKFADKAGISADELARALKRWQPLSSRQFARIVGALSLPEVERSFLEALHLVSDTDSSAVRATSLRRLLSFDRFRKAHPREHEAWRFLTHWYYVAIQEMSRLAGFRADPSWIRERLIADVSLVDIRKALKFLEGAGFFTIRADGSVDTHIKEVRASGGVYRVALRQFHLEMLALAGESIERVPSEKRLLLGHTAAISPKSFDQARRILEEAMTRIAALDPAEQSSEPVYHFELVAMPLSQAK